MAKRTNSIVAVTVACYATVYVEADTPREGADIVKDNIDTISGELWEDLKEQFQESDLDIDSYEAYTTEADDGMGHIWADGRAWTADEYMEAVCEEDEED